ncbi:MAG: hypothetical protein P4L40_01190, partial [Terracidiphilus sp.]|nr:hypothetical protein [Terracidiphilus sp.]
MCPTLSQLKQRRVSGVRLGAPADDEDDGGDPDEAWALLPEKCDAGRRPVAAIAEASASEAP